jgi:rare lipoprotein A (peptidoglycan hydrolase)
MTALLLALSLVLNPAASPRHIGVASWYDATRNGQSSWYSRAGIINYAASAGWRWGQKPYMLRVCRVDNKSRCVIVTVVDWCGRCQKDAGRKWNRNSRILDLSPAAFTKLEILGRGLVRVSIQAIQPR